MPIRNDGGGKKDQMQPASSGEEGPLPMANGVHKFLMNF